MKKRILVTYWNPPEAFESVPDDFEVVFPEPEVTGAFSLEETLGMLPDFDGVLIGHEDLRKDAIDRGLKGRLKVIGRHGVGCDSVDYDYAGSKGVAVINTPLSVTEPAAELTVAIMLAATRSIAMLDRRLRREGRCRGLPSFDGLSISVVGKTLGIIGFGRIGRAVARKARGLGMKVIYSDIFPAPAEVEKELEAARMSSEEVFASADVVSLHCAYTPENHHLVNAGILASMKPDAYLVNASRGKMVDEAALAEALEKGVIKGAALDVFEFEPEINSRLLALENVVIVPHIGTACYDARLEMTREALAGMIAYLNGDMPPNVFNRDSLVRA